MNKYELDQPPGAEAPRSVTDLTPSSAPEGVATGPGASNRQLNFLTSLSQEREMPDHARDALTARIAAQMILNDDHGDCAPPLAVNGITKARAHDFIQRLLERPKRPQQRAKVVRDIVAEHAHKKWNTPSADDLPTGYYAIKKRCTCPGGERPENGVHIPSCDGGQLRFYRVWRGTRNKSYIKMFVQHGPDETEIPFGPELHAIAVRIAEAPLEAMRLYGRHIGSCGSCGKRLTNRVSRLLDIGPVCGKHKCDPEIWDDMKARAKQALMDAGLDPDADVEDTDDLARIRELAGL
jgi:hypothetical protein